MAANLKARDYLHLHVTFIVYSLIALLSKLASGKTFLSAEFWMWAVLVFVSLAGYALLWQQALKAFPLVKAYANKAVVVVWNMLWATLLLRENITLENMIGSGIIIAGIVMVSGDER